MRELVRRLRHVSPPSRQDPEVCQATVDQVLGLLLRPSERTGDLDDAKALQMQRDRGASPVLKSLQAVEDLRARLRPGSAPFFPGQLLGLALLPAEPADLVDDDRVGDSPQVRRSPDRDSLSRGPLQQPHQRHLDQVLTLRSERRWAVPLHCTDQHLADPLDVSRVCVLGAVVAPLGRAIRQFRGNHTVPLRVTFARDGPADFLQRWSGFLDWRWVLLVPPVSTAVPRRKACARWASARRWSASEPHALDGYICLLGHQGDERGKVLRFLDAQMRQRAAEPAAAPVRRHRPDARWRRGGRPRVAGGHRGVRPGEGRHRRGLRHDVAHLRAMPRPAALRCRDARPALAHARAGPDLRQGGPPAGRGDSGR